MGKTEIEKVHLSDLRPGDVLLHNGRSWISKTILLLDGGDYSHASIFVGPKDFEDRGEGKPARLGVPTLIQATLPKVEYEPVDERRREDNFIVAYRWHSPQPKQEMGSEDYPPGPVLEQAATYIGEDYAKHELALVALLIVLKMSGKLTPTQRWLVALVGLFLNDTLSDGKRTLVCSELVARSFDEARYKDSQGHYHLLVEAPWYLLKAVADPSLVFLEASEAVGEPSEPKMEEVDTHLDEAMAELGLPAPPPEGTSEEGAAVSFEPALFQLKAQAAGTMAVRSTAVDARDETVKPKVTSSDLGLGDEADDGAFRQAFLDLYVRASEGKMDRSSFVASARRSGPEIEPPPALVSPQAIGKSSSLTRLGILEIPGFEDTDNSAFNLRVSGWLLVVLGAVLMIVALLGMVGVTAEGGGSLSYGALAIAAGAGLLFWARRKSQLADEAGDQEPAR